MRRTTVPKALLAPDSFMGPKARGQGPGLPPQQSRDTSPRPSASCPPCCQHNSKPPAAGTFSSEPGGRGKPRLDSQTHAVCGPSIPGLREAGPGPLPGNRQPALASPLGASFHLGKSRLPHPPPPTGLVTHRPLFCSRQAASLSESNRRYQGNKAVEGTGSQATCCWWKLEDTA